MSAARLEIRIKGRTINVPCVCISGQNVVATGGWLRTAAVHDQELTIVHNPDDIVSQLRSSELKPDIFTFCQSIPDVTPHYPYRLEWDNAAVVPITTFAEWFEKRAASDVRKAVRKAHRLGVVVREAPFEDSFVAGISRIYDESPMRQGTPFWHYKKDFATVKRENGTYLDRSIFIGAFHEDELVGFIKMVRVGGTFATLQVISQQRHFDKKPTNALIAKAIEICEQQGASHLIYGSYTYDGRHTSLTEFKRRNGFEQVLVPRYYAPLSILGSVALKLGIHHRLRESLPAPVQEKLRTLRRVWYERRLHAGAKA